MDKRFLQEGFANKLAHFVEECGESMAAAGKTQRWGPFSYNPLLSEEERELNVDWLLREMADLRESMDRLESCIKDELRA